MRNTLFQNLEYPYITSTNGNARGDMLSLSRSANFYYPKTLKNSLNEKGKCSLQTRSNGAIKWNTT